MARTSHELDSWREPPLFRLPSTAIPLHGNHLNKVWQCLVHREGVAETGFPMIVKWLPDQIKLMTELACAMAAQGQGAFGEQPVDLGSRAESRVERLMSAITAVDQDCFGWRCDPLLVELRSTMQKAACIAK